MTHETMVRKSNHITTFSQEDDADRYNYIRCKNFRGMLNASKTLTAQQKATLWGQARKGDLDGAMRGYKKLVSVREGE